jgi:hypothetical protein
MENNGVKRAHWIFEAEEKPEYAPPCDFVIDITDRQDEIREGFIFNQVEDKFIDPETLIPDSELMDRIRGQRDSMIQETDWMIIRHRDQLDNTGVTSLCEKKYLKLLAYRQALRDIPTSCKGNPRGLDWPARPDFL